VGLSITIAALDRLIELEKFANREIRVADYKIKRNAAMRGLRALTTPEGYFIRSLDPDGVQHGVYGANRHGYFEASPNHDAIAFRVVDDQQAIRIFEKISSIPQPGLTISFCRTIPPTMTCTKNRRDSGPTVHGERRSLVHLRGPDDAWVLPAGQI
jgi:hypothetical protein